MSIAGGLHRALELGKSIDCTTIQIFTKNSNQWAAKELTDEAISAFRQTCNDTGIHPVFAHCSYLINLGSANPLLYEKSIQALIIEVDRAERLGLDFVVLHPGAHTGSGDDSGLRLVVNALNRVIHATGDAKCKIAIENTAGQGSCLGCRFEHLGFLLNEVAEPSRIGFCIDTCHLFAAGYDIRTRKKYEATIDMLLNHVPLRRILAFHLNDSKKELGSRIDRHAHIGKGFIGKSGFRYLLNDKRFLHIPKVLETPKGKDLAEDVMNLNLLRGLSK
ncbi:MAG: deoxyribonuclease IV [Acidobacteria bacterium]|nr:MAG: deoxyribonuclease IV [Acidobacteriota bacterium]